MTQIFISTAELAIPRGIRSKKAKAETEAHPATTEAKTKQCLTQFKIVKSFSSFLFLNSF